MILQALIDYAKRAQLGDAVYERVQVRWLISLGSGGEYQGVIELVDDPAAKKPRAKTLLRPFTSQNELSPGKKSHFLCDNLERALGWAQPGNEDKIETQHGYFKLLIAEAKERCTESQGALAAIWKFLGSKDRSQAITELSRREAKPTENVTFRVNNAIILDHPEIRQYWEKTRAAKGNGAIEGVCLATGEW